jgi:histone H3/H4
MGLTKASVAKKAGAKRVANDLHGAVEEMYVEVLDKLLTKTLHTKNRRKKTVSIDDVRHALKSLNEDVLIDPKTTQFHFPVDTFKSDLKNMAVDPREQWTPRFTKIVHASF